MNRTLLVIDDDPGGSKLVKTIFNLEGFDVVAAFDGPSGLEKASAVAPAIVLLDVKLPLLDGLKVLEHLKAAQPTLPVVMLTGSRDVKNAVRAMQLGAFDYLTKPIDHNEVVVVVRRALEASALRREVEELRRHVEKGATDSLASFMGPSPQVQQVIDQVDVVSASPFTVLLLGETGTGKEIVARAIHQHSGRKVKPFVALDCGAIPEALLESELFGHEQGAFTGAGRRTEGRLRLAEGGTCFLDEVGNLPMSLQVKLLRVLESREVLPVGAARATPMDVRFIAATNDDLHARIRQGRFRADLYFRLAQYTISLPALRDRVDDVAYLTQRFMEEASVDLRRPVQGIVPEALESLRRHGWPGNVRELRNVIRQAVLETQGIVIRTTTIESALGREKEMERTAAPPTELSLRQVASDGARAAERGAIADALRATRGNKSRAARLLRTDFKTLHVKMRALGIDARDFDV